MILTVEEFFKERYGIADRISTSNASLLAIEFAKLHVEAALEAANENWEFEDGCDTHGVYIKENSIINSYPLTNIK